MALLAGPPRRDENKEEVVALVRRRLCLVPQSPYTTSVTQEPSEGTPNCCLRARILDSVLSGSSKRRPYFHTCAQKKSSRNFGQLEAPRLPLARERGIDHVIDKVIVEPFGLPPNALSPKPNLSGMAQLFLFSVAHVMLTRLRSSSP